MQKFGVTRNTLVFGLVLSFVQVPFAESYDTPLSQTAISDGWAPDDQGVFRNWTPSRGINQLNLAQFAPIPPHRRFMMEWYQYPTTIPMATYVGAFGINAIAPATLQGLGLDLRTHPLSRIGDIYWIENYSQPKSLFFSTIEQFEQASRDKWSDSGWAALEYLWVNLENFAIYPGHFTDAEKSIVIDSERRAERVSIQQLIDRGELQDEYTQRHVNRMMVLYRHLMRTTTVPSQLKLAFEQSPFFSWVSSLLNNPGLPPFGDRRPDWWTLMKNDYLVRRETSQGAASAPGAPRPVTVLNSRPVDLMQFYMLYIYYPYARVINQAEVDAAYATSSVPRLHAATVGNEPVFQTELLNAEAHFRGTGAGQAYPRLPQFRLVRPYYEFGLLYDRDGRAHSPSGASGNRLPIHDYVAFNSYLSIRLLHEGMLIWDDPFTYDMVDPRFKNTFSQIESFAAAAHVLSPLDAWIDGSTTVWDAPLYSPDMQQKIDAFEARFTQLRQKIDSDAAAALGRLPAEARARFPLSASKRAAYIAQRTTEINQQKTVDVAALATRKINEIAAWETQNKKKWSVYQPVAAMDYRAKNLPVLIVKQKGKSYLVAAANEDLEAHQSGTYRILLGNTEVAFTLKGPWAKVLFVETR